jgi:Holliday junction resolvasome RuvABC ATP-dependent DNA helicase subunit
MKFYGQENIVRELNFILENIRMEHSSTNILFRAPSGCGKTTLGLICAQYLGIKDFAYYIPDSNGLIEFRDNKWIQFIDEAHTLIQPEIIYPYMDSKKYVFLLASNESGELKEPLKNRCIQFIFHPYTNQDISLVVKDILGRYNLTDEIINEISSRCRNTPRIAKVVCERLIYIFNSYLVPRNLEELNQILTGVMNIKENGINEMDQIYLNYLYDVRKSSLTNLIYATGIDRNTILTEIEPHLLHLRLIKITSKGREIC